MLDRENTGLIVVDIQGKLARLVHDSNTLITNCEKLIKGAQFLGLPIICLEQNPDKLGASVDEIRLLINRADTLAKFTFNACQEPTFVDAVRATNIDTWLVCGIETHICVYQTAIGLAELGYKIKLVSDCTSSRTFTNKQLGVSQLMNKGVDITGLEMCLYELVKDCRSPEFRQILALVR
ncbi:isochorismatase family protein [Paraglaciecola sp. 25GB23A]|uniref:isochorismatase family protein n=1 Tax=Paraglaciecola sp. 25GB23A TaxID=3156068 RepID=UPI0032B00359